MSDGDEPAQDSYSPLSHRPSGTRRLQSDIPAELMDEFDQVLAAIAERVDYPHEPPTRVAVISRGLRLAMDELRDYYQLPPPDGDDG